MAVWSFFGGPHQNSVHILLGNATKAGLKGPTLRLTALLLGVLASFRDEREGTGNQSDPEDVLSGYGCRDF